MNRPWIERWMRLLRPAPAAATADTATPPSGAAIGDGPPPVTVSEVLELDRGSILAGEFPGEYPIAASTTAAVVARLGDGGLAPLARRSPSLAGYDWANYLHCSECRVVRVLRAVKQHVPPGGRVLDYGSYFGNFGLACQAMGFRVDAVDSYREYGRALAPWVELQRAAGIAVYDFSDTGHDVEAIGQRGYDAVICAGVIEHIPHSPKALLDALTAALVPGGVLLLDTPNLAYLYKRLTLVQGQSIFAPIEQQYFTELPFEGHHREYTVAEVEWMLRTAGQDVLSVETFNYSVYGQSQLTGEHLEYYRAMMADPSLRELIVSVSRRRVA